MIPNVHRLPKHEGAASQEDRPLDSEPKFTTPATSPAHQTGRIHYTRTQVVEIAPEVYERHRAASVSSNHPKADAFRLLRTQLLLHMRENGWQTLAVTSPNKGAGKSTIALNLAINFALEVDYTALLVDADLRDPYIRDMLELRPGFGLADYLLGKVALPDLLIHPNIGDLVVLPGSTPVPQSSELMRSPMMVTMVHEMRSRYPDRLIVFDVPPILTGADTLALSAHMDAVVLLVEECKTSRDDIRRSCQLLAKANLLGIVLNKSRELRELDTARRARPGFFQRMFKTG